MDMKKHRSTQSTVQPPYPVQYVDYISQHEARVERQKQMLALYSDKPEQPRKNNLWMHGGIDRQVSTAKSNGEGLIIIALAIIVVITILYNI